jgi:hypothetical protein
MGTTPKQQSVIAAMRERPDYWITEPADIAEPTGLTEHGVLIVLYHLSDAGIAYYDDLGWHLK